MVATRLHQCSGVHDSPARFLSSMAGFTFFAGNGVEREQAETVVISGPQEQI
jgi:hypothetical protein